MAKSWLDISGENDDYAASVYAFFDNNRYLFDCGEGCQRVLKERSSIKISKIKSIFITNLSWDSIGGLMGIFYILAGIDQYKEINIYGPRGLYNMLYSSREFLNFGLKVNVFEMNNRENSTIQLGEMTITTIPLYTPDSKSGMVGTQTTVFHNYIEHDVWNEMTVNGTVMPPKDIIYKHLNLIPKNTDGSTIVVDRDATVCFMGETSPTKGRFYPDKATALGIPKGALFQQLNSGQSVVSPKTGELITPDRVCDPAIPGTKFLIVKCPSVNHLSSLVNNQLFRDNQNNIKETLSYLIHMTPMQVLQTESYQQWMTSFGVKTKHIIVNKENCSMYESYGMAEREITKFASYLPTIFPKEFKSNEPVPLDITLSEATRSVIPKENIIPCVKVTRASLAPSTSVGTIEVIEMEDELTEDDDKKIYEQLKKDQVALELKETILEKVKENQLLVNDNNNDSSLLYPRIMFTGTGAAKPSKQRGVTGHLVETSKDCFMLLDGGEGTIAQITRSLGRDQLNNVLLNLKMIWVSHLHADHHLGVPSILERRCKLLKQLNIENHQPIKVVSSIQFLDWLQELNEVIEMDFTRCEYDQQDLYQSSLKELNIKSFNNVMVDHSPDARGAVITFNNGFKLSFSGDTRPCDKFIQDGQGSDIMIHEATFEDDLVQDSIEKKHSTMGEALSVGHRMNAKCTILTHISNKTKSLKINTSSINVNPVDGTNQFYGIAFDHLSISPYQYPLLTSLNQLIQLTETLLDK